MAGLVTYDVLGNERHKAVCELRKIPGQMTGDTIDGPYYEFYEKLANAIGIETNEGLMFSIVRDRLIHLLGGDRPSGIDVLREMDTDGTSHNDNPTSSITDELREWASDRHCKGMSHTDVLNIRLIADRIDEQFDRICKQQEAVLQSTIDGMVDDRDNPLDLLREAAREYQRAVRNG